MITLPRSERHSRPRPVTGHRVPKAVASRILKGQFHGSAHVHIIYSPVHALLQGPLFSLFMNQSEASCLISYANSHEIINRGINPTGQN